MEMLNIQDIMPNKIARRNFPVVGMGCASCVARVQNTLKEQKGVANASVSLASNMAQVDYDPATVSPADLKKAVQAAGYDLIVDGDEDSADDEADSLQEDHFRSLKRDMIFSVILALLIMLLGMGFGDFPYKGCVLLLLATPAVFWCGRRFIGTAWKQARHGSSSMDTLVALSILISYFFSLFNLLFPGVWTGRGLVPHLYFESSSMITAFILIGRVLEERAKHGTTKAIRDLAGLQPKSIHILVGDTLMVKPGERIPVDGEVVEGEGYVDESMLTGEPVASYKEAGSKVWAGTMNQKGSITVRADKVGNETMLSAIVKMVRDAQGSKARIQNLVDKVASVFVPVIIGISILTLVCWLVFSSHDGLTMGLLAMVSVLVIACPCSLGLATPTALTAGIGNGARHGILIKDADSLQVAGEIDCMVFDKTGTLTEGRPAVSDSWWNGSAGEEERAVLLAMERKSEHPLAGAVAAFLEEADKGGHEGASGLDGSAEATVSSFEAVPGHGIKAVYGGKTYYAGNESSSEDSSEGKSLATKWKTEGKSLIYFRKDSNLVAVLALEDKIKPSSIEAVASLKALGVETLLLTGDNKDAARHAASLAGISKIKAGVLPQDKEAYIAALQAEGHKAAMAGDGINDSAALAKADLSIAMGGGSDIAMDTAMATIVSSDLRKTADLIKLSRRTSKIIKENLFWAFIYNVLAIPVAAGVLYPAFGFTLSPTIASACMALSSVCVVTNSLRLR